jgi:hypothetical protein
MRFVVGGYQGKIQAGWMPPSDGPPSAFKSVAWLLQHEMDEFMESVERRRRSDSFPREQDLDDMGVDESDFLNSSKIIRVKYKP